MNTWDKCAWQLHRIYPWYVFPVYTFYVIAIYGNTSSLNYGDIAIFPHVYGFDGSTELQIWCLYKVQATSITVTS